MIRVAVDGSALHAPYSGIGRYLASVLRRLVRIDADVDWTVYGRHRDPALLASFAGAPLRLCADGMPVDAGRIASLFTSQPWWARRQRPDVFWGPAHRLPLALPRSTARVVTVHDLCWLHAPQTMRRTTRMLDAALMPRAVRSADRIIAVSHAVRDELSAAIPSATDRIVVVHEAAETLPPPGPLASLAALGLSQPFVLFVGTAEPRKNLARLIEAFAGLPHDVRQATQLAIVGSSGWGDVEVERLLDTRGVADRACRVGVVDDALLSTLYRHARCLALPSLYEGFGLPLVEAMAQGTPVLTSLRGATAEVAGEAAERVDCNDADAISRGLQRVLMDDGRHARLSEQALAQSAKFSWDSAARQTLSVLREALAARR